MRNQQQQQQESGNRYQFRLHPVTATIDEEQQLNNNNKRNNNINKNINVNNKDNNNKCTKTEMSVSMRSLTSSLVGCGGGDDGRAALKDTTANAGSGILQRKQFTTSSCDASNASFSSASLAGSIQDDMSERCSLTQAGLEEYNSRASSYYDQPALFHHQKQSSYAQSEGYHSYVSSSDSSSATPFLDRLRQESDLLSRQSHHWSQNDLSSVSCHSVAPSPTPLLQAVNGGRGVGEAAAKSADSSGGDHLQQQQHNSSESTSSTETLKWLGSMSDVSEASHVSGYSAISESVSSSQLIAHSSRVRTPQRHHSESVLYLNDELQQQPQHEALQQQPLQSSYPSPTQLSPKIAGRDLSPSSSLSSLRLSPKHRHSPSYPPLHVAHLQPLNSLSPSGAKMEASSGLASNSSRSSCSSVATATSSPSDSQHHQSEAVAVSDSAAKILAPLTTASVTSPSSATPLTIVTSCAASPTATLQSLAAVATSSSVSAPPSASPSSPASAPSPSIGSQTTSYRSNHRLFPVSTYAEPVHSNTSQYVQHPRPQFSAGLQKPSTLPQQPKKLPPQPLNQSPMQPTWQSVSELINDFERGNELQPQKYSYIDPSKTHRVPNPALKAFQKNAVQSYFERQQQQQQHHSKEHSANQQKKIYQLHLSQQLLQQQQQQLLRPHSYQSTAAAKELADQLRKSLPSTTTTTTHDAQSSAAPQVTRQSPLKDYAPKSPFDSCNKPPSPAPPPPPPRTRSLMPTLLRRSSSASDCAEFRDQFMRASQEKLHAQSVKNISSAEKSSFNDCGMPPPPPPPRGRASLPARRTSSASEYAAMRDLVLQQQAVALAQHRQRTAPHQYYSAPSTVPPLPPPSIHAHHDAWVPERPPKNPSLRVPSPELPPPPAEVDSGLSDEPLPPPPPEILHRHPYYEPVAAPPSFLIGGELLQKPPSQNRRNSFAGSSTRKPPTSFFNCSPPEQATAQPPPLIPKKPSPIELLQASRPASTLAQQCNKAHKVLLNGGNSHGSPQYHQQQQNSASPPPLPGTCKTHFNRKRPHNPPGLSTIPPIMENTVAPSKPSAAAMAKCSQKSSPPPPPLKPRLPITVHQGTMHLISSKLRCNSKASYLPRQSLEKLSSSDPDHGSYKLTLTSNEDLVGPPQPPAYDILALGGKLPSNLPDVLPLGAKLQPSPPACYPHAYPTQQRYSTPALGAAHNYYNSSGGGSGGGSSSSPAANYSRSQSCDVNSNSSISSPTKFLSQSTVDLKKARTSLETTFEEAAASASTAEELSAAQSENNLTHNSSNNNSNNKQATMNTTQPRSPFSSAHSELQRTLSLEERHDAAEGRLVRAEPVNTTLAQASLTRKDSLRENIEKITQLQSQLMSAHLCDSAGLLSSYGVASSKSPVKSEAEEHQTPASSGEKQQPPSEAIADPNGRSAPSTDSGSASASRRDSPALAAEPPKEVVLAPLSQMDCSTDGLKLMQRSEIILRLNPATVEAASQTEDVADGDMRRLTESHQHKEDAQTSSTLQPRQPHRVELDCEQLSRELTKLLAPNDKLVAVLAPGAAKSPADYVGRLYNANVAQGPTKRDVGTSTLVRMKSQRDALHEPLAEQRGVLTVELQYAEGHGAGPDSGDALKRKVDELMAKLSCKLKVLGKEQAAIGAEAALNDELGRGLVAKLAGKVRPFEATKLRTYIDDVGHITSLLLALAGRLAKTDNSLSSIDPENVEKKILELKRDRLLEQLEEAKRLQEDIGRRGGSLTAMLQQHLGTEEFADFDYFINMKAKLIADGRELLDKIKSGEEQLQALGEALMQSDC